MDLTQAITGAAGVVALVGVLVEIARRSAIIADRWTPLASVTLGAALGPAYYFIGWLGVPPTPTPNGVWLAAIIIGIFAGSAADGATSSAKSLAGKGATP